MLDLYGADVAAATGRSSIPQAGWDGVRVYVPQAQRIKVKRSKEFERVERLGTGRVYLEEIAEDPSRWALICRESMMDELEAVQCLGGAQAFWMMWPGYLEGEGAALPERLAAGGVGFELVHASGHGSVRDLQRFGRAMAAKKVVPMHTERPDRYAEFFDNVELHRDGEWWEV